MRASTCFLAATAALFAAAAGAQTPAATLPQPGLVLDLDADRGVTIEDNSRVAVWQNQCDTAPSGAFVKRDEGRDKPGSGRPTLLRNRSELNGHDALVFRQQELVNMQEDAFDGLTTGGGYTWFAVAAVYEQREGLKDVNSIFGNLRNGGHYEGLWANVQDDNTFWSGPRNGRTFGRFDENNPLILGPRLAIGRFYILASRMGAGDGEQTVELFVDEPYSAATGMFPVNPAANPSRMAVGQERDAVNHPGVESFDGEIARLLVYDRPLSDAEMKQAFATLKQVYRL